MVAHPSTTISPSSAAGATAPESLLARYISTHVRKGEQAEERANQAREKAEQHFIAAGTYLATLKAHYCPTWEQWEATLKIRVKLSVSRASELMAIASGTRRKGNRRELLASVSD
jgi:hypothetical protein